MMLWHNNLHRFMPAGRRNSASPLPIPARLSTGNRRLIDSLSIATSRGARSRAASPIGNQPSVSFSWAARACAFARSNLARILTALPSMRVIKAISTRSGDFNSTSVEKILGRMFGSISSILTTIASTALIGKLLPVVYTAFNRTPSR
jgi:hypothetical protein